MSAPETQTKRGENGDRLFIFPGYGTNAARYNGADLEPIPISPVRGQNWPEMQIQLSNGWMRTNYGKKLAYDDYLRLLRAENGTAGTRVLPGQGRQVMQGPGASQTQQFMMQSAGNQPRSPGGTGMIAEGVDLSNRRFYG
jgi:hypothetical protein